VPHRLGRRPREIPGRDVAVNDPRRVQQYASIRPSRAQSLPLRTPLWVDAADDAVPAANGTPRLLGVGRGVRGTARTSRPDPCDQLLRRARLTSRRYAVLRSVVLFHRGCTTRRTPVVAQPCFLPSSPPAPCRFGLPTAACVAPAFTSSLADRTPAAGRATRPRSAECTAGSGQLGRCRGRLHPPPLHLAPFALVLP